MGRGGDRLTEQQRAIAAAEEQRVEQVRRALQELPGASVGGDAGVDPRQPYFGRMRVRVEGREREVMLGFATLIDRSHALRIVDWRKAPLAAVFFNYEPGDLYDEEVGDRQLSGELLDKRLVVFRGGELAEIHTDGLSLRCDPAGGWTAAPARQATELSAGTTGELTTRWIEDAEGRKLPRIAGLLDDRQRTALRGDPRRPLLIVGGAGCGKTTVALHRLAQLHHDDPQRFPQKEMLVVVPELGLAHLTEGLLGELGLDDVGVFTFDDWIAAQAHRVFADLPRSASSDPPARVAALKRHPAVRTVLPELIARITEEVGQRLDRQLGGRGELARRFAALEAATPLARLQLLRQQLLAESDSRRADEIEQSVAHATARLYTAREDLLSLFGDRALLERTIERAGGALVGGAVDDTLTHTRRQLAETAEQRYADVDRERRTAVDGLALDEATPEEAAGTVDVEDYAVAFELLQLKTGALRTTHGRLRRYAHLLIDEAQELAPIELGVLGHAKRRDASVTVCGDQAQHTDLASCFADWQRALVDLDATRAEAVELRTSYRCSAPITELAHAVLGRWAPAQMPEPVRDGPPVIRSGYPSEAHAAYEMVAALGRLTRRSPRANVAVIAATPGSAQRIHEAIDRTVAARLVLAGDFSFTPGIDVTTVSQVKGLEFDVVIVPDVNATRYPDSPVARRRLHVACTRAIHQLWLLWVGSPSPILESLPDGTPENCP